MEKICLYHGNSNKDLSAYRRVNGNWEFWDVYDDCWKSIKKFNSKEQRYQISLDYMSQYNQILSYEDTWCEPRGE